MCEFSGKLIVWMDGELCASEAATVERHLESCAECRSRVAAYQRVSSELLTFCDATFASSARRESLPWVAAASAAGAVAALLGLFLVWPRVRVERRELHVAENVSQAASQPSPAVAETPASPLYRPPGKTGQRHFNARAKNFIVSQNTPKVSAQHGNVRSVMPNEPVFQITIPAEDMLPPGAVPDGVNFFADVAIAADGSADGLRLRPRLAGFERRTTEP